LSAAVDKVILLQGDGVLVIIQANPNIYDEISRAKVLHMKDWRTYPGPRLNVCWAAPVLVNGRIYARNTYGDLVCVDMRN